MSRFLLLLPLAACTGGAVLSGSDSDEFAAYDGANLRITEPGSGDRLMIEEAHTFTAELRDASDVVMPYDDIAWSSSADAAWLPTGATFSDDTLAPGMHDITAEATLPNGDRVAHTIGGVRLQSKWAGTYAGLFSSNVHTQYQNQPITVTCSGAATLMVDLLGERATGGADCVVSLNGNDVPVAYTFELTNEDGDLTGTAILDLAFAQVPFEATGTIDPDTFELNLAFGGDIPVIGTTDGTVAADRVSLDVE